MDQKPKVYFATDHAGFDLIKNLEAHVAGLGFETEHCGPSVYDPADDYPDFISVAARAVADDPQHRRAIILGGSGQGEAIVANRFKGVRAVVYYGEPRTPQVDAAGNTLSMIESSRIHNDANVLSIGARFVTAEEAKSAITLWLNTSFPEEERHVRRIDKIDTMTS